MLERGKFCSSAAIATALAVSGGNQISPDGDGVKLSLHLPNERYACNPDSLYALPRTDLHKTEWIDPDSVDAEVSRLVTGSSTTTTTTTTRNNPRRCCRTSTSSGYSSHSPPLSAGSYSCYASAIPGHGTFRTAPLAVREQFGGGLAVIHEGEAIPRPIWPSAFAGPREFYNNDDSNPEYDAVYACCGCSCAYTYSYCDWDYGQSAARSAHDVLLELSRTLNSVIEGETAMTPEEILHNISHTVAQGIGVKGGIYEYVYHNSTLLPRSQKSSPLFSKKASSVVDINSPSLSCSKSSPSRVNPVNSKLYSNARHFYMHNPAWSTSRQSCEHTHKSLPSSKVNERTVPLNDPGKKESTPAVFVVHDHNHATKAGLVSQNVKACGSHTCKCLSRSNCQPNTMQNIYVNRHIGFNSKEPGLIGGAKQSRNGLTPGEPEYTMQLGCSDGGSSSEGIVSSKKNDWKHHVRGFAGELDFTLDVSRAERLGRAIAKAKRKRQWCRALTAFFGLVFFVLSVVVVSLSVTRGRKVFGSM